MGPQTYPGSQGSGARGGIQCPGLKVAVQVVVQHGAAAALASSPHPSFAVIDCACGVGCDPEFLVRVFFACFSSLLSDSMSYSIAFQQISQSWFLLLANEKPDFVQLQLVSVNRLQMLFFFFFFLHCLPSLCLCLPGSSTNNPEKEE